MKKKIIFFWALICLATLCRSQSPTSINLIGKWDINDTINSHSSFRVILEFTNDSSLNCLINDELKYVFNYKIILTKDSSFILLKRPEENYDQSYRHILSVRRDTLQITPLYFILLPEYHLESLQNFYFIHRGMD